MKSSGIASCGTFSAEPPFWNRPYWNASSRTRYHRGSALLIIKFCANFMTFGFNIASLTDWPCNPWYTGTLSLTVTSIKRWDAAGDPAPPFACKCDIDTLVTARRKRVMVSRTSYMRAWFSMQRSSGFIWRREAQVSMIASFVWIAKIWQ